MARGKYEIFREIGIAALVESFMEMMRAHFQGAVKVETEMNAERQKKTAEFRNEVFAYIGDMPDQVASTNLIARHRRRLNRELRTYGTRERYNYLAENEMVTALVDLYRSLCKPEEREERNRVFQWLGHMTDENFDNAIEFLKHDYFMKMLMHAWDKLNDPDTPAAQAVQRVNNGLYDWLENFNRRKGYHPPRRLR